MKSRADRVGDVGRERRRQVIYNVISIIENIIYSDCVVQLETRPTRDRVIAGSIPTPGSALVVWPETSVSNSLVHLINVAGGPDFSTSRRRSAA